MIQNQEWLSGNLETQFPFRESCLAADNPLPSTFLVDLRIFLPGLPVLDIFLSRLEYNQDADVYTLAFARMDTGEELLSGSFFRQRDMGQSRVFRGQTLSVGYRTCLFTPGPAWDDPASIEAGSWEREFDPEESAIEPTLVNPGPMTFQRIFIDGQPIPPREEWPLNAVQKLQAGYNISFSQAQSQMPVVPVFGARSQDDSFMTISAAGGLGLGYPPRDTEIDYLATLSGAGPDSNGNLTLSGEDCLRVTQPTINGEPIEHTLQILSDCQTCCSCVEYRAVSAAVSRRSAKIVDLCDRLNAALKESAVAYNEGVKTINARRPPMVRIRNVRALGSQLVFSIQNISSVLAYAYVGLDVNVSLGAVIPADGQFHVFSGEMDRNLLPPVPFCDGENPGNSEPPQYKAAPSSLYLTIGQQTAATGFAPLAPGASVDVALLFVAIDTQLKALVAANASAGEIETASLAARQPVLTFRSAAVYGSSRCWSCKADVYKVKVVPEETEPDAIASNCKVQVMTKYKTIPFENEAPDRSGNA